MNKKLLIVTALALCSINIYGQHKSNILSEDHKKAIHGNSSSQRPMSHEKSEAKPIMSKEKDSTKKNENNKVDLRKSSSSTVSVPTSMNDSAFYQKVVRKNGWYVGIGKRLSKEQVSHMNCYYKLSNKNAAGNWMLMQAYSGSGSFTTFHDIPNYLIRVYDSDDDGTNEEWKNKLSDVCQWVFIESYDGKTCIQEQGLDESGNIIYSMVITKISPYNYYCTYIDNWGRPAYMRTDKKGNDIGYANFVETTRDKNGYEILVKYFDRNGLPAKNRNGSYMLSYVRDTNGNVKRVMALNILGETMIDDWGYSGEENTFDSNGNKLYSMYLDINGNYSTSIDSIYGRWWTYDDYGNMTEGGSLDKNCRKCTSKEGVFKFVAGYDEQGNIVSYAEYDINGDEIKDKAALSNEDGNYQNNEESVNDVSSSEKEDSNTDTEERYREVSFVDTLNNSITIMKYDGDAFYKGFVVKEDPYRNNYTVMYNITSYGEHARIGYALYYAALIGKDMMGNEVMMGSNEFGEPAYITDPNTNSVAFLYTIDKNGHSYDYDEFGIERSGDELDSLSNKLPSVYCVEVTDTAIAYPLGIRNNDIILSLGNWRISKSVTSKNTSFSFLAEENKTNFREMVVLRHYPEEKRSVIIPIQLKKGSLRELGFQAHLIYYTQQEKKRLIDTAETFNFEFAP